MKLQNLTVIFIIIIIPVILLVSLYISTGLKTIKYQSLYDTGLLTATHDAIYAFELNTTNDAYSDNAETKRNILKSSVKMFEKSLANTCGISAYNTDEIEEYIPAIVFGMYDGFYMYAPSYNSKTGKYEHSLKNYVYYSETLDDGTVITYSLDNYVTVVGKFKNSEGIDKYQKKEGYLMDIDDPNVTKADGTKYKGIAIDTDDTDAINYYTDAYKFTYWFLNTAKVQEKYKDGKKCNYLDIGSSNDPEDETSSFVQHKREIMKKKIESVLNSSITAYSERTWNRTYKMPKLSEEDWQKIYNNISMIAFFQGKNIGLTKYNGYCVLNSTNSNEYVNPNLMYFIDNTGTYHDIRCSNKSSEELKGYKIGDFQKIKLEKALNDDGTPKTNEEGKILYDDGSEEGTTSAYKYKHYELACYDCVNGSLSTNKSIYNYIEPNSGTATELIKTSYWTSLARERYRTTRLLDQTTSLNSKSDIVNIEIEWNDGENASNRPTSVSLKLLKNGDKIKDITVSESDGWYVKIDDLGIEGTETEVKYTLDKYYIENYYVSDFSIDEASNTFKITYTPIKENDINITIQFDDDSNRDGIRPSTIAAQLYYVKEDGTETSVKKETLYISDDTDKFILKFKSLTEKESNGRSINYKIKFEGIDSRYTISGENEIITEGKTITFTHIPETIEKEIQILYDDYDNFYRTRPDSVDVKITGIENGYSKVITLSKNENDEETDFKAKINLPKYYKGKEVNYTLSEVVPKEYEASYVQNGEIITITNTLKRITKWEQNGKIIYGKDKNGNTMTTLNIGDYINYSNNQGGTWRVIGVENDSLKIARNEYEEWFEDTFYNVLNNLDYKCAKYLNTDLATSARSITPKDVNDLCDLYLDNYAKKENGDYYYGTGQFTEIRFGELPKDFEFYFPDSPIYKEYDEILLKLLFSDSRTEKWGYWLKGYYYYDYGRGIYGTTKVNEDFSHLYCAHFSDNPNDQFYKRGAYIRPVVTLKKAIKLEIQDDGSYNITRAENE